MKPWVPKKYERMSFAAVLATFVSIFASAMTALSIKATIGSDENFFTLWFQQWSPLWGGIFFGTLIFMPLVNRIQKRVVREDDPVPPWARP
ncbi:MAG TPA: hypothetical protein VMF90_19885 [Rhizobiaceae bacterium]|nr:hypothetical protein [Rhizobiaceae bacterium]